MADLRRLMVVRGEGGPGGASGHTATPSALRLRANAERARIGAVARRHLRVFILLLVTMFNSPGKW